jgi:membrane fusion protein, copper/silver efflux system
VTRAVLVASLVLTVVAALAAGAGYWAGHRSALPAAGPASGGEAAKPARKILYYRNPMGLPDTSPTPKKDPMGMEYVPVYEGGAEEAPAGTHQIRISTEKIQKLGVRTEAAGRRALDRVVRAVARLEADERRQFAIAPKFEGYIQRLYVNATGQPVQRGQPLFDVYSPELVSAQREYAIASEGVRALGNAGETAREGMKQLAQSSLQRLKNWDISDEQIQALARSGTARHTLTFRSPVSGIVTEKKAVQGMRFMPGEALYQVADLSSVWAIADVFEQDIGLVKAGAKARVRFDAYPGKDFEGTIAYVYPTLKPETRTIPVRIELPNPQRLLKPGMFAQVELPVGGQAKVLAVPASAIIDSGTRRIALVQLQEGRFEPREVKLGARSEDYVEVLEGVREGEPVVVAANFLIDAESNLKAAVGGFAQPGQGKAAAEGKTAAASVGHHAEGRVEEVDAKAGTLSLSHGPVPSLKWPAMTMEFKLANEALLQTLKPGAVVSFEFVERGPGEWVITAARPAAAAAGR